MTTPTPTPTNRTYYSREAERRASQEKTVISLSVLAVGMLIGAAIALLIREQTKRPPTFGDVFEDRLESGQKAADKTLRRLERDFSDFRKSVEDRLKDLR
jgi:hypothetical protein